jgi:hypothetical protein
MQQTDTTLCERLAHMSAEQARVRSFAIFVSFLRRVASFSVSPPAPFMCRPTPPTPSLPPCKIGFDRKPLRVQKQDKRVFILSDGIKFVGL